MAADQEVSVFLKTCQSLQLNPFANECFLIKYDQRDKAAFVIALDSYLKTAETNPNYDGCEAGVILKDSAGKLDFREGAFLLTEEKGNLVGGWAKVYRKDRTRPTYVALNKNECIKLTREGRPTQFWSEPKQPWMLRKSALKRSLAEAFPSLFAGTLATAEIEADIEGMLPRAFENNGQPDWPKFWAKVQNELQLTEEQVHGLLGVESVKEIVAKSSLEEAWVTLVAKLQELSGQQRPTTEELRGLRGVIDKAVEKRDAEAYPQPMDEDFEPLFDDTKAEAPVDMSWLNESIKTLQWKDVAHYVKQSFPEAKGKTLGEAVDSLTAEQREEFVKEVQRRLEGKGKD